MKNDSKMAALADKAYALICEKPRSRQDLATLLGYSTEYIDRCLAGHALRRTVHRTHDYGGKQGRPRVVYQKGDCPPR